MAQISPLPNLKFHKIFATDLLWQKYWTWFIKLCWKSMIWLNLSFNYTWCGETCILKPLNYLFAELDHIMLKRDCASFFYSPFRAKLTVIRLRAAAALLPGLITFSSFALLPDKGFENTKILWFICLLTFFRYCIWL